MGNLFLGTTGPPSNVNVDVAIQKEPVVPALVIKALTLGGF